MTTNTEYLDLTLDSEDEFYDIEKVNNNMKKIDKGYHNLDEKVEGLSAEEVKAMDALGLIGKQKESNVQALIDAIADRVINKLVKMEDITSGAGSNLLGKNLTAARALVSDVNGKVGTSTITAAELQYLAGLNKNAQGQFNELTEKLGGMKISPYTFLENVSIKDYIIQQYNKGYRCGIFSCIAAPDTPNANESWGYQVWWVLSVNDSLVSVLITRSYTAKIWSRFLYVYAGNEKWVNDWAVFATESYVDNKVQAITATANSDWIAWGDLKGFSIMGKFFLSCPEFQFAKSESFGNGDNALLWTLSTDTGIYGRVFYVHTSSRMVRLRIDGNTVRGHYDTPPTGDVFTVNEFFG